MKPIYLLQIEKLCLLVSSKSKRCLIQGYVSSLMKVAIQRRQQLASYASSSKDIQSEQTVIPECLSALKEKIEKDVIVSAHKS